MVHHSKTKKGHGKIIDVGKLDVGETFDEDGNRLGYKYITKYELDNALTIIEADVVEKSKINKAIAQLEEEKEFAYDDFDGYNEDVLSYDDTDICERDTCYIGLTRAIEILKRNLGDEE